jgi:hypothetical protein
VYVEYQVALRTDVERFLRRSDEDSNYVDSQLKPYYWISRGPNFGFFFVDAFIDIALHDQRDVKGANFGGSPSMILGTRQRKDLAAELLTGDLSNKSMVWIVLPTPIALNSSRMMKQLNSLAPALGGVSLLA